MRTKKRLLLFIFVFLYSINTYLWAQGTCQIELSADIKHCTCLNDGEIRFKLTDSTTCIIDTLNIRYSLYSPSNGISSENSISPIFKNLPPGNYTAIVSALNQTEEHGTGANIILYDTLNLNISTSYTEPTLGILNNEFTLSNPYGFIKSMPCIANGIVQVKISGGKMPYTIQVLKFDGTEYSPYKIQTFESQQHHGDNPVRMDYHDYYNIDSLSAGKYRLIFSDACTYTLPYYEFQVHTIPYIENTSSSETNANNDNGSNRNIIYTNLLSVENAIISFAQDASYYVLQQQDSGHIYWKYRWIDPAINGHEADTSEWENIVFGRVEHSIDAAEKYCDLWGQNLKLQILDTKCLSQKEYIINIQKPQDSFRFTTKTISQPESSYSYTDSCGRHSYTVQKTQYDVNLIPYKDHNKLFTTTREGSRDIHYHIKDVDADTLIKYGIINKYYDNDLSYRQIFDFDSIYHGKTANFTVTDAMNCTITDKNFVISSKLFGTLNNPSFNYYGITEAVDFCDYSKFTQYYNFPLGLSDLDTFQITKSPGSLSNMSMVYKADLHRWLRLDSNERISIGNHGGDLIIKDIRATGSFTFRYVSGCYTVERTMDILSNNFGTGKYYVPNPPVYHIEHTCTGIRIIPLAGGYKQYGFDMLTNNAIESNTSAVFRFYGNPSEPESITGFYHIGDSIDISLEGDFRIEMCDPYNYTNSEHLCHFRDTIIHCSKPVLQYDYFYSYCCKIDDSVSTVRTRANGGLPPYLYIISDKNGNYIDSNRTGDFFNLPLPHHDTVRLKVIDQCGTSFTYQGQVIEQQLIKKAWFEDGNKQNTISDSNWCQLFAITFDNITYHWDGPNGFCSEKQNPKFFVPVDSNMSGKYYLSLHDSVCGLIQDSLMLKVMSKNHIPELLWIDDSICSGKTYNKHGFMVSFTPSETESVHYDTIISLYDDSTFLKLTILPIYRSSTIDSIVTAFDSYMYNGIIFSDTGLYEIKLKNSCHCDSIIYVHLMFSKYLPCPEAVDYNGHHYPAIRIGKYCWTTENLKSLNYSDGRPIVPIYEYYAYEYPNTSENVNIFGRLYDWYAAIDSGSHSIPDSNGNLQGICPEGWLLPTEKDFEELKSYTPQQLRSVNYWILPGTNESGFNSLPAGYYDSLRKRYANIYGNAYYWSTQNNENKKFVIYIYADCIQACIEHSSCNGYSIRCIKKN